MVRHWYSQHWWATSWNFQRLSPKRSSVRQGPTLFLMIMYFRPGYIMFEFTVMIVYIEFIWCTQQSCSVSYRYLESWRVPLSKQREYSEEQVSVSVRFKTKIRQSSYHRQLRLGKYIQRTDRAYSHYVKRQAQQQINLNKLLLFQNAQMGNAQITYSIYQYVLETYQ